MIISISHEDRAWNSSLHEKKTITFQHHSSDTELKRLSFLKCLFLCICMRNCSYYPQFQLDIFFAFKYYLRQKKNEIGHNFRVWSQFYKLEDEKGSNSSGAGGYNSWVYWVQEGRADTCTHAVSSKNRSSAKKKKTRIFSALTRPKTPTRRGNLRRIKP